MADRIKLRRGLKSKMDLNAYELGYATDSNEKRLYFNNGSMVPIPNEQDITDIKTVLTKTTNVSNKNKQDILELKESIDGISTTGVVKLVQHSYDIKLSENTKKVNIPYERYSSVTDTLKVYVNGLAIQNDQYTITDPVENNGAVTNGYIMLKAERPIGTIVRIEVWKNVLSGEEGNVSGNIIARNTLPLDRIIGLNDITSQWNDMMYEIAGGTATAITLNMPATLKDGYWKKFIASGNNNGEVTTINAKPLYKVSSTNSPILNANRPYEIYYNLSNDCFFLKASATGTTSADKVLAGETFSTENDTDLVGTMPNKGAVTSSLNCGGSYTIPAGYHNGSGRVTANSLASQTQANATAENIIKDKTAWVNGSKIIGTATLQSLGGLKMKTGSGVYTPTYTVGTTNHGDKYLDTETLTIPLNLDFDHKIFIALVPIYADVRTSNCQYVWDMYSKKFIPGVANYSYGSTSSSETWDSTFSSKDITSIPRNQIDLTATNVRRSDTWRFESTGSVSSGTLVINPVSVTWWALG